MPNLLQISSSLFSNGGQSSQLANRFAASWRQRNPGATYVLRDLARDPVPHLDAARFQAFIAKPDERTPEQQAAVEFSDTLIDEIRRADVIVIGLPMYNFGVPSTLKAYFDHIARAGVTFRYTDTGALGLLGGRKVYVFAARGGLYLDTPRDTQTGYVRDFLHLLGIDDVEFVYAEGLGMGEASKERSLAQAHRTIERLHGANTLAAAA